ncbi:hypothetical protein [Caenispirillum bisanense]|uniref:hypothetical protein n=1 Tax=Caenispirillum bisanense TaxID=414052 RepID=UPI0031CEE63F
MPSHPIPSVNLRLPGSRPPGPPPAVTAESIDAALRTLARLLRDHSDLLGRQHLLRMAETLFAERERLQVRGNLESMLTEMLEPPTDSRR